MILVGYTECGRIFLVLGFFNSKRLFGVYPVTHPFRK